MMSAPDLMSLALSIAFISLAVAQLMCMIRLVLGPSTGDRILALDTMVINALGLVILLGIHQGVRIYFEVSLLIAMLGFVSTVSTCAIHSAGGHHRMTFEVIGTYATAIFLLIGSGFALVGVLGLLKFNDSMTRLHAPTKVGTVGIGALLLAVDDLLLRLGRALNARALDHGVSICHGADLGEFYCQSEHSSAHLRNPACAAAG